MRLTWDASFYYPNITMLMEIVDHFTRARWHCKVVNIIDRPGLSAGLGVGGVESAVRKPK